MNPEEQLRIEALRLALAQQASFQAYETDVVKTAAEFYAFLLGQSDKTPREAIDAALAEAGIK